jgi:hypothetical protein
MLLSGINGSKRIDCKNTEGEERHGHPRSHRTGENVGKVCNQVHSDV